MDATLIGLLFVVHWKRIDSSVARPGKRDDNARKSAGSGVEAVQPVRPKARMQLFLLTCKVATEQPTSLTFRRALWHPASARKFLLAGGL